MTGGVADLQPGGGDGVDWSVDNGAATLVSGTIPNGGAQSFSTGPGATNLADVAVGVGDVVYFVVGPGPNGNHVGDSTRLDVTIRALQALPIINSFTPTHGTVGTTVNIVGTNFTDATNVTFNGTNATYSLDSDTQIHATVPAGATTGTISVTTPQGTATSNASFAVTGVAPAINSFTPVSGPAATTVEIHGAGFTDATSMAFNGTTASFTTDSDSEIHATVPNGATTGPISVTTPSGTATSPSAFTVIPPPTIAGFSPPAGPVGGSVEITGQNLDAATSVSFNDTAAIYTVASDSKVHATVPTGVTTGPISVTTPGGTATSSSAFSVVPPPTIMGVAPSSGRAGRPVTITGSNFTDVTAVKLGTTRADFTLSSSTVIEAVVPTIARGYYTWTVTTASGTATSTSSFRVR